MATLRQIRYFLAVADLGGFTAAAAALHVAQPALSRQLAELEEEIGARLLHREPRGVSLTPAGLLYRERVRGLAASLDHAADDARRLAGGEGGVLRLLHSSSTPVAGALLGALGDFAAAHPGARVEVDRLSSELQLDEVAQGRVDLGVVRLPLLRREPAVEVRPLAEERLAVALAAGHPLAARPAVALADLAGDAFVSAVHRERGGLARRVADLCLAQGFTPRPAAAISRKTAQLNLVAAGFGVAVVPPGMVALATPGVVFRPLADGAATTQAALLLPRRPSPLAAALAAAIGARWGGEPFADPAA